MTLMKRLPGTKIVMYITTSVAHFTGRGLRELLFVLFPCDSRFHSGNEQQQTHTRSQTHTHMLAARPCVATLFFFFFCSA